MSGPSTKQKPIKRLDCVDCATRWTCIVGGMDLDDLAIASLLIREHAFRSGAELCAQGATASSVKIIKIGTVLNYRLGKDGRRRPIGLAGRGSVFGICGYLGHANPMSVVAVSEGRYCELALQHVQEQTRWGDAFRQRLMACGVQSFGLTADWSAAVRLRTLVQQLAHTLLLLSEVQVSPVVQLPTHTALAELLGTTRESVARSLTTLGGEGCITKLERRKCQVHGDRMREWLDAS